MACNDLYLNIQNVMLYLTNFNNVLNLNEYIIFII